MKKLLCIANILALALTLQACKNEKAATSTEQPQATAASEIMAPGELAFPLAGKVLETFNSGGYTYMRLDTAAGEKWAAVMATDVAVGEEIAIGEGSSMFDFHSKTLERTFDEIIFSSGIIDRPAGGADVAAPVAAAAGSFADALQSETPMGDDPHAGIDPSMMGSNKAVVTATDIKVDKATGDNAYTVGEVYAKAAELNGKKVRIKGQIMKVSKAIMGKNWLHIQDGSGDTMKNTHDLVVTTAEMPEKGQVITIEGLVSADKDFGAGYRYDVIVEDAMIAK